MSVTTEQHATGESAAAGGAGAPNRSALSELPVIDIGAFMRDSTPEERAEVARQLRRACIDIGFFYLVGHGMTDGQFDDLLSEGRKFFALPLGEKEKVSRRAVDDLGFRHSGGIESVAAGDPVPDMKERFFMSRDLYPGEEAHGGFSAGNSKWPEQALLPRFEGVMKDYIDRQVELTKVLARAFAMSLELPEDYFDEAYAQPDVALALNFYPSVDSSTARADQWSFAPHSDYGSFTILLQDDSGGLQVCNTSGDWIDAPPRKGTLIVNLGDFFPRWTNDLYVSTLHRGLHADADEARISAAFFVGPQRGTIIECLPTCYGPGNPARYPPVESVEYADQLRKAAYDKGTPGIAPMTAKRLSGS